MQLQMSISNERKQKANVDDLSTGKILIYQPAKCWSNNQPCAWHRRWGFIYSSPRTITHSCQQSRCETQRLKNRAFIRLEIKAWRLEKKEACANVRLNDKYNIFAGGVQFYSLYLYTLVIITWQFRKKSQLSWMNYGVRCHSNHSTKPRYSFPLDMWWGTDMSVQMLLRSKFTRSSVRFKQGNAAFLNV